MHGAVDQVPGGGRTVRLVPDEMRGGRVGRDGGQRDDQVAERMVGLKAAAGADADQLLAAELDQLLEDDRRAGTAHAGALDGDRLALVRAGVAEQPALRVPLFDVLEVRLGDVLRAQRVARQQNGLGVLARLGADVNRHGGGLYRTLGDDRLRADDARGARVLRRVARRARLPRGRRAARPRPVRRRSPRPAARWRRCVTSARTSCRRAPAARRSRTLRPRDVRMLIGEAGAVGELWDAARARLPRAARGSSRPTGVRDRATPPAAGRAASGRPRSTTSPRLVPACAAAHELELGIDPLARDARGVPLAHRRPGGGGTVVAVARGRRRPLQGRGVGLDSVRDPAATGVGRPRGAGPRLRRPRARRPDPTAAAGHADGDAVRPRRERTGDRALRAGRDEARARVPERALLIRILRRLVRLALVLWVARWAALEGASLLARRRRAR